MSHMGEGNWRLAREDRPVRLIKRPLGIGGLDDPPTFLFQYRPGPATLATLVSLGGERFRLLVSEGEVLDDGRAAGARDAVRALPPGHRRARRAWTPGCGSAGRITRSSTPDARRTPGASSASWRVSSSRWPERWSSTERSPHADALTPGTRLVVRGCSRADRHRARGRAGRPRRSTPPPARPPPRRRRQGRRRSRSAAGQRHGDRPLHALQRAHARSRSSPTAGSSRSSGRPTATAARRT